MWYLCVCVFVCAHIIIYNTHLGVIVITMIVINKLLIFANYESVFTKCVVIVCECVCVCVSVLLLL